MNTLLQLHHMHDTTEREKSSLGIALVCVFLLLVGVLITQVLAQVNYSATFSHNLTSPEQSAAAVALFIAIGSAPGNRLSRDQLRATWLTWTGAESRRMGIKVDYRFFTERTGSTVLEQQRFGDIVFQAAGTGYQNHALRFFEQVSWVTAIPDKHHYFLRLDDDGFLCLPRLCLDLLSLPRTQFFWGKFFCEPGRVLADENFMLFSWDVVEYFHKSKHVLRVKPEATFAAHFGVWQHMLNITVFDDRARLDVQQGWITGWMQGVATKDKPTQQQAQGFCRQHIWAHHVTDKALIQTVFNATSWGRLQSEPAVPKTLGVICDGAALPGTLLLDPSATSLAQTPGYASFPRICGGPGYNFTNETAAYA